MYNNSQECLTYEKRARQLGKPSVLCPLFAYAPNY